MIQVIKGKELPIHYNRSYHFIEDIAIWTLDMNERELLSYVMGGTDGQRELFERYKMIVCFFIV